MPTQRSRPSECTCREVAVIIAIVSGGLNIGLIFGIVGPTLPDLALIAGVSLTTASTIVTWRAITFIFGSLSSGIILEYLEGYLSLSVTLLLGGVTTALAGWFSNFTLICFFQAMSNFFGTILVAGLTFLIFQLDSYKARMLAQTTYLLFNVGKTIVPLIAGPFLAPSSNITTTLTTSPNPRTYTTPLQNKSVMISHKNTLHWADSTTAGIAENPVKMTTSNPFGGTGSSGPVTHVEWVYVIIGLYSVAMSALYAGIAITGGCRLRAEEPTSPPAKKSNPLQQGTTNRTCKDIFAIFIFLLAVFSHSAMEYIDSSLLLAVIHEYMGYPKETGLLFTSLYQGVKIVTCFIVIFLTNKFHPSTFVQVDVLCMTVSTLGMTLAAISDFDTIFFVGIIVLGVGMSNYYASMQTWIQLYFPFTSRLSAAVSIAFGLSGITLPPLSSYLLDQYGLIGFPTVLLACSVFCLILIAIIKKTLSEPLCPPRSVCTITVEVDETTPLLSDKDGTETVEQQAIQQETDPKQSTQEVPNI